MINPSFREKIVPLLIFTAVYSVCFWITVSIFPLIFPFLLGFLIAALIQPLIRFLSKRLKWSSGISALLASVLAYVIILGLVTLAGYFILTEITSLIGSLAEADLSDITAPIVEIINDLGVYINKIDANFVRENQKQIIDIAQTALGFVSSLLMSVLSIITSIPTIFTMFIVMIFATYFFSKDMQKIKSNFSSFFSAAAMSNISTVWRQGLSMLGKYTRSYCIIYSITFIETLIVFSMLNVPYPLLLSILAAISDVLPVIGPIIVYVPLALIAFAEGNVGIGIGLIAAYFMIAIIRQIIEPKIVADSIDIHPLSMLAALYVGLKLGSIPAFLFIICFLFIHKLLIRVGILQPLLEPKEKSPKKHRWPFISKNKKKGP